MKDQEKSGLIVSMLYKVPVDKSHCYTLSIFYTTCSLLVNGKYTDRFLNTDLPTIHEIIKKVLLNGNKVDLQTCNQVLQEQLQRRLDNKRSHTVVNEHKTNRAKCICGETS